MTDMIMSKYCAFSGGDISMNNLIFYMKIKYFQ